MIELFVSLYWYNLNGGKEPPPLRLCIQCTQDTVIAMKALSGFAQDTFTRELNKIVTFDLPALTAAPLSITPGNRYERNTVNVSSNTGLVK